MNWAESSEPPRVFPECPWQSPHENPAIFPGKNCADRDTTPAVKSILPALIPGLKAGWLTPGEETLPMRISGAEPDSGARNRGGLQASR